MNRIVILLIVLGWCHARAQEATQQCPAVASVVADGNAEEWSMGWVQDEDKMFSYNTCADDSFLYVRVKTSDNYTKRKIAAFGFTLWMDSEGKKKKKLGLRFPVGGVEAEERAAAIRDQGKPGSSMGEQSDYQKEIDQKLIADLEIMELIGLTDDPITSTRSGITNGIKVAIGYVDGAYVYEAIVPFKAFRLSKATLNELSVGFETGRHIPPKAKKNSQIMTDYTNPQMMSRMQGYQSLMSHPKLAYTTYVWTLLKFK